jgi:hypothetical protein
VRALGTLGDAKGREHVLRVAIGADNEEQALYFQQLAEMLAGYHREQSPILEILPFRRLVVARAKNGHLVALLPVDEIRWTRSAARALRSLGLNPPGSGTPKKIELWVSGGASGPLRQQIGAAGIALTTGAQATLGLLD